MKFKIYFILFTLLNVSAPVLTQPRIYETNRNYEQGDWITYSTTRYVNYVSLGNEYVYFATTGGITRYNFYNNKWEFPWTISNGLADNEVYLVAKDFNTGYLWTITRSGISYLEPTSRRWHNVFYDEIGMDGEVVRSFGFGDDQRVYIKTSDGDWYFSDNHYADFQATSAPSSQNHIQWYGKRQERSTQLPHFFMEGGYLFDNNRKVIDDTMLRNFAITTWVKDDWSNMWLGTWGLGAARGDMNMLRLHLLKYGLWNKTVDAIAPDGEALWIGGMQDRREPAGVTQWFGPQENPNYYEPHLITGFDNDRITSIVADDRFVFFGTRGGLTYFDKQENIWKTLRNVHNMSDERITDVILDDQSAWAATLGGVSRVDKQSLLSDSLIVERVLPRRLMVTAVHDLDMQDNIIWMGTELGLYRYDKRKKQGKFIVDVDFVSRPVYAVSVWKNEVWFGTDEGVGSMDINTRELLSVPSRLHRVDAAINRMLATKQAVWVATNNGVLKYDRFGNRWRRYTVVDGLSDNLVYALYQEGDYMWFGTANGLTRFYWNAPYRTD